MTRPGSLLDLFTRCYQAAGKSSDGKSACALWLFAALYQRHPRRRVERWAWTIMGLMQRAVGEK